MPLNKKVIAQRNQIIKKYNLKLLKIFDTNEHENYKDVVLVFDPKDKKKKVLRVGEHRTKNFLYHGYQGKYLVVPKIYKINTQKGKEFEIEEYILGRMLDTFIDKKPLVNKILPNQYMDLLIKSFWEFQQKDALIQIPEIETLKNKTSKHLNEAIKLIDDPGRVINLFNNKRVIIFFTNNKYISKWKFAVDNLIITPDNKVGFIDLARVGKRFWGYDFGWVFWVVWFHMPISEFKKPTKHFNYLENFFKQIDKQKPKGIKVDVIFNGYLIILERIIGALYDIAAEISHARKINSQPKKRKVFINFLNKLLELTLDKIEK